MNPPKSLTIWNKNRITIYVPTARDQSNYNGFEHDTFLFCDVRDVFEPFFYPERSEG